MRKWLLSSDQQIPYHDPKAVELWFKVMKSFKPDVIDYLGDQDDQACYSRWTEGRSQEFINIYKEEGAEHLLPYIQAEAKGARELYEQTRKIAKNAELFVALGNHDVRVFDYVDKKLNEISKEVTPNSLWGLDDLGYDYIYYGDKPRLRYGGLYAHHGVAISKHAGESVKADMDSFGVSIIRGHCFSADTEILTRQGYKTYTEINVGDEVYTLNRTTGLGEWQAIEEKFVYDTYDSLIHIKSSNIDLMVTDGHGMVYREQTSNGLSGYKEITAKQLKDTSRPIIPLAAESSDAGIGLSDDEVRMLAWIVAEGNFDSYTTASGEKRNRVRISQSDAPDGRLDRLATLFKSLGWEYNPVLRYDAETYGHGQWRNHNAYRVTCRRSDCSDLVGQWITNEKTLVPEAINMSARQAKIYLNEYVWTDGSKNSAAMNSYQLAGNNYDNMSMLQALAVKSGYRSSLIPRPSGVYCLTFNTRQNSRITSKHFSEVEYSGDVWCVTVPNHTLAVRRNGKTAITMNSHRLATTHKTYDIRNEVLRGYELGHMSDIASSGMSYTNIHNWAQGFAYGYIDGDEAHISLVEIKPDYTCVVDGKKFSV